MNNTIRVIKNAKQHAKAIKRLSKLMDKETDANDENIELLALVIEQYEKETVTQDKPTPIEAIKFRMEQENLTQRDLIPYIGSLAKVSEVLSGKRKLSLNMIRNLSNRLGISADILIAMPDYKMDKNNVEWAKFPLAEMRKRNYFGTQETLNDVKEYAEEKVTTFLNKIKGGMNLTPALLKTTANYRFNDKEINPLALWAWQARILYLALKSPLKNSYKKDTITDEFITDLCQCSRFSESPILAKEFLNKHGIHLIIEPHFKQTYLDGAVCTDENGNPVIALTLRHDRLDNFWFTLMHEIMHLKYDIGNKDEWYIDDLDNDHHQDPKEQRADDGARNALIAEDKWNIDLFNSVQDVTEFANKLKIHPCIVVGRLRRELGDYTLFARSLKIPKVRRFFIN